MTAPERFRVDVVQDRPPSGMWHCGPNPSWVTVTHLPTMTQARAYHHSQHKARAAAMACVQMMIEELLVTDDVCNYPEALAASPEVAALIAEARREERERAAKWHEDEIARLEAQIVENQTYVQRMRDLGRHIENHANAACRSSILTHKLSATAIRALKEETP